MLWLSSGRLVVFTSFRLCPSHGEETTGVMLYRASLRTDAQPSVCFASNLSFVLSCFFYKEIDLIKDVIKFINWQKISLQSIRKRHKKDAVVSLTVSTELLSRKYEICLYAIKPLWA